MTSQESSEVHPFFSRKLQKVQVLSPVVQLVAYSSLQDIKNIRTKSLGSNNKQNVVLATIEGLKSMKTPEEVARLRGKSVSEILG